VITEENSMHPVGCKRRGTLEELKRNYRLREKVLKSQKTQEYGFTSAAGSSDFTVGRVCCSFSAVHFENNLGDTYGCKVGFVVSLVWDLLFIFSIVADNRAVGNGTSCILGRCLLLCSVFCHIA